MGNLENQVLSGKTSQSPTRKSEDPFFIELADCNLHGATAVNSQHSVP